MQITMVGAQIEAPREERRARPSWGRQLERNQDDRKADQSPLEERRARRSEARRRTRARSASMSTFSS